MRRATVGLALLCGVMTAAEAGVKGPLFPPDCVRPAETLAALPGALPPAPAGVAAAGGAVMTGSARALDGATLLFDGRRIRLWGIDVPPGAADAAWLELDRLVGARLVVCRDAGLGHALCYATRAPATAVLAPAGPADWIDLGGALVWGGFAVDLSGGFYCRRG